MISPVVLNFLKIQLLFIIVNCDSLSFSRRLTCSKVMSSIFGKEYCVDWHQTSKMEFHLDFFHLCFPRGTLVRAEKGILEIQNLQKGDKILSYNFQKSRVEFSQFNGWISRDSYAISTFAQIKCSNSQHFITQSSKSPYYLSPLHSIAKINNKQNKINQPLFVFSNTLKIGDSLLNSNPVDEQCIRSIGSKQMMGLYAPLIQNSNFFIYPFEAAHSIQPKNMVLVHCYSQIQNPQKYQKLLTPLLGLPQYIRDDEEDPYRNPIYILLRLFFGQNWKDQNKAVSYDLNQLEKEQYKKTLMQNFKNSDEENWLDILISLFADLRKTRLRKNAAVRMFALLSMTSDNLIEV